MIDSTKLPLRKGFLAMYLTIQAKTGLSALALKRYLGMSYCISQLKNQTIMLTMARCDAAQPLEGDVQLDYAYLRGQRLGVDWRISHNKVPFAAAVTLSERSHPMRVRMLPLPSFTLHAVMNCACKNLVPGSHAISDRLIFLPGVLAADFSNSQIFVGLREPFELPAFKWVIPYRATSMQPFPPRIGPPRMACAPPLAWVPSGTGSTTASTSAAWQFSSWAMPHTFALCGNWLFGAGLRVMPNQVSQQAPIAGPLGRLLASPQCLRRAQVAELDPLRSRDPGQEHTHFADIGQLCAGIALSEQPMC